MRTISRKPKGRCSSSIRRWIVGFVDGEGCFSVSVHRNPYVDRQRVATAAGRSRCTNTETHRVVLEELVPLFGWGECPRRKARASRVLTFAVDGLVRLERRVIPYFEQHPSRGERQQTSQYSHAIVRMRCERKEHLEAGGIRAVVRLAYAMNAEGKQRPRRWKKILRGILRDCTPGATHKSGRAEETVRAAWRHAESGRNDLTRPSASKRNE